MKPKHPATTSKAPNSIPFTSEDLERLEEIYEFLLGLSDAFKIGETGHHVEYSTVAGLVTPMENRARDFFWSLHDRFSAAERGQ